MCFYLYLEMSGKDAVPLVSQLPYLFNCSVGSPEEIKKKKRAVSCLVAGGRDPGAERLPRGLGHCLAWPDRAREELLPPHGASCGSSSFPRGLLSFGPAMRVKKSQQPALLLNHLSPVMRGFQSFLADWLGRHGEAFLFPSINIYFRER